MWELKLHQLDIHPSKNQKTVRPTPNMQNQMPALAKTDESVDILVIN